MYEYLFLYYICEAAGVLMVAGGIWLIYKQKIYMDPAKRKVLGVHLPFFGKLYTNVPALALFVIGFIPLIYPIQKLTTRYLRVEQELRSDDYPVTVYIGIGTELSYRNGKIVLTVPLIDNPDYKPQLIYRVGPVVDRVNVDIGQQKHGLVVLDPENLQNIGKPHRPSPVDVIPPPDKFK